jgi:Tfp pilus assembly protein PilN
MIKINLVAERKPSKAKAATPGFRVEPGQGGGQTILLSVILLLGLAVAGGWWWVQADKLKDWNQKVSEAEKELTRLEDIRKKGDEYKRQKDLLERKISLITELKKKQSVPVHILDQISKNLPEFLWLDSMEATQNQISISGKATTYNAVSNFYDNLSSSGYFTGVDLGKTSEAPEGVSFSLTCKFQAAPEQPETKPQG